MMVITVIAEEATEVTEVEVDKEVEEDQEEVVDTEVEEEDLTVLLLNHKSSTLTMLIVSNFLPACFLQYLIFLVTDEQLVAVKIRGLDYNVSYNEIKSFFNGYNYVDNSVILGKGRDGRNNGFGSILMKTEDDAENAVKDLNKKYIGERYVDLSIISYSDYRGFNSEKFTQSKNKFGGNTCKLF